MYNHVTLVGEVSKDPELKYLDNGTAILTFQVETSKQYKNKDGEWKDRKQWSYARCWGKIAENTQLAVGDVVIVNGMLATDKYEVDGKKVYKTYVDASFVSKLGKFSPPADGGFNP